MLMMNFKVVTDMSLFFVKLRKCVFLSRSHLWVDRDNLLAFLPKGERKRSYLGLCRTQVQKFALRVFVGEICGRLKKSEPLCLSELLPLNTHRGN